MTYEPIIKYAPIIVPIVLALGITAVTVHKMSAAGSASALADAMEKSCADIGPKCVDPYRHDGAPGRPTSIP